MLPANAVRSYAYLAGVFQGQQRDPFCPTCKAFVNSVNNVRDSIARFETEYAAQSAAPLTEQLKALFSEAKSTIARIPLPEGAEGQKRAGNCLMPTGVCFVKNSISILEKI